MATESVGGIHATVDVDTAGALASIKVFDSATKKIEKSFKGVDTQVSKTAKSVNKGLSQVGRGAGQAGIQLQQFIGQIQGGQNAMLALSQQSADLGFVLGAPLLGAVVGIAASLAGILVPTLFESGESVDELIDKMKEWKKTIGLTREQANLLIQKEIEASTVRAKSIAEITKNIEIAKQQIRLQEKALLVERENDKVKKNLLKANRKSKIALNELIALRQAEVQAVGESNKQIEIYNAAVGAGTDKTDEQKAAIKSLNESLTSQLTSLEQQAIALIDGEEAAFRWATAQRLGMKDGELFEQSIDDRITAIFKLRRAQKKAAEDKLKEASDERKLESRKTGAENFARGITTRGTSQADKFASELDELKSLRERGLLEEQAYVDAKNAISAQSSELVGGFGSGDGESSEVIRFRDQLDQLAILRENELISLQEYEDRKVDITRQSANAEAAIQSARLRMGEQIFGDLASIAKDAAGEQSGAYRALFAVQKGFAIANASLNLATSISNASAVPWPANIPAIASAVASGAAIVSQVASVSYGGGRENGGPVSGGSMYEVGEKNKPELLLQGGKQYMIPGNNGKVVSNKDMQGSGKTNVIINNNAPGVQIVDKGSTNDGVTEQRVFEIIASESGRIGSNMNRNINKNHNVTSRLGGTRAQR